MLDQVRKPKKPRKRAPFSVAAPVLPVPRPPPASEGPVFAAKFGDGTRTRMSIYSGLEPLDLERAIKVSQAAWSSRAQKPMADAPPIIEAHFETRDGVLLASYDDEQIKGADK
jgi:hypothetical protein